MQASNSIELLCTLGPSSFDGGIISRLEELGATLFRINLSHTALADVAPTIERIRAQTSVPICLDSEGAQIRTGRIGSGEVTLRDNAKFTIPIGDVEGDEAAFSLYPPRIAASLRPGDFVSIDFDSVFAQVTEVSGDGVTMRVLNGGRVGSNKAVSVHRSIIMPAMTDKDREAIQIGRELGIDHFALSFANHGADVDAMRALTGPDASIISKIECRLGLQNFRVIASRSDAILIDRGDLSREIAIEKIPETQKRVIAEARRLGTKAYVATNLLESMVTQPMPTRAEVNDIYNTLADGASGLVLAAETAIGAHPVRCANMIARMIHEFANPPTQDDAFYTEEPLSMLIEPHGGQLVQSLAGFDLTSALDTLPLLEIADTDVLDCEQIAIGTYSPLDGFMDRETLESVLADCRLPNGTVWTMPIVLSVDNNMATNLTRGQTVALGASDGNIYATIDVSDVYCVDLADVARRWFGTNSTKHPGVERFVRRGQYLVGGRVTLVRPAQTDHRDYQLTPLQIRKIFAQKGWSRVVGFHTRNAAHRVHEYIQIEALRSTAADGLFISPVTGPKQKNDFLPGPVMKSYQAMLDLGAYPAGRVVLGAFSTYSRYCGPREAVFTALCRKNMGCSHFIIGRDHTGVGDFYGADANREMFSGLDDLGIEPVFFDAIGFDPGTGQYRPISEGATESISGTEVRERLRNSDDLPTWFMRPEVQDALRRDIVAGKAVFSE